MPMLVFTAGEVFAAALDASRDLSVKLLKLANIETSPLAPGETADARRHQIAKLGKALAEAFLTVDKIVQATVEQAMKNHQSSDVTAGPIGVSDDKPHDPDPNSN